MSTCLDIITSAMRELGVLSIGRAPKAAEAEECLFRLQSIVDGMFGCGVGSTLTDQIIEEDTELVADTRCLVFASGPLTLAMPEMPFNGARIQIKDMLGNLSSDPVTLTATPSDIVLSTSGADYMFVYIADSGTWALVSPLLLTSTMPVADDEFFILNLAKRIAPMFGAQFADETALLRAANRIRAKFAGKVVVPCDDAVRFLSRQSWRSGLLGL